MMASKQSESKCFLTVLQKGCCTMATAPILAERVGFEPVDSCLNCLEFLAFL